MIREIKKEKISDCNNLADLTRFFTNRSEKHGNKYFHYTTLHTADIILTDKEVRASQVKNFNDERETYHLSPNHFAFCLSTGDNENLSLWYLYSGIRGDGCRIKFTYTQIEEIMNNSTFILSEIDENNNIVADVRQLEKNKNLVVKFIDALYYKKDNNSVHLKYNNCVNHNYPASEFDCKKISEYAVIKDIIWYYEKETRILFEVKNIKLDDEKKYVIRIKPPIDLFGKLAIRFAPEIKQDDMLKLLNEKKGVYGLFAKNKKIMLSEHSGKVSMNLAGRLCKDCDKKK